MDANLTGPGGYDALEAISGWVNVVLVTAVILVELALLQAFAVGVTTGIYYLVPLLAVGEPQGFADWRSIFQVVSATMTLPGGGVIVLSIYLMARRAQQAERRAAAIEAKAAADLEAAVTEAVAEANERAAADVAAAVAEANERAEADVAEANERAAADLAAVQAENAALKAQLERRPRRRRRPLRS